MAARNCKRMFSTIVRNNRGLWTTKVYTERLRPLSPLYTIFEKKGTVVPLLPKPRLELCVSFNCRKCAVFQIWINHKNRAFSRLFHCRKMHLLALMGHFTDRTATDFPTLSYTSTIEIPTLSYTPKPEIGTSFGRSLLVLTIIGSIPRLWTVTSPPSPFFFYPTQTVTWLEPVWPADNELCIWKVINIRGKSRLERPKNFGNDPSSTKCQNVKRSLKILVLDFTQTLFLLKIMFLPAAVREMSLRSSPEQSLLGNYGAERRECSLKR